MSGCNYMALLIAVSVLSSRPPCAAGVCTGFLYISAVYSDSCCRRLGYGSYEATSLDIISQVD